MTHQSMTNAEVDDYQPSNKRKRNTDPDSTLNNSLDENEPPSKKQNTNNENELLHMAYLFEELDEETNKN